DAERATDAAGGSAPAAPANASGLFDVYLVESGPKLINVIKAIRELTGIDLKQAKAIAEHPGSGVVGKVTQHQADLATDRLHDAGAIVNVVPHPG
ncbi:MAG TPA: ribosomal protein L7/L12, partial [Acidimicrobiales bacterium]